MGFIYVRNPWWARLKYRLALPLVVASCGCLESSVTALLLTPLAYSLSVLERVATDIVPHLSRTFSTLPEKHLVEFQN